MDKGGGYKSPSWELELKNENIFVTIVSNSQIVVYYIRQPLIPSIKTLSPSPIPYPWSQFYFDINVGNRLYSKEKRPRSPLLF